MKANEIRIGNYVYLCNDLCHLKSILSPNKTNGYMVEIWINGPVKTKLENIKSIPLDEEWLERLGFVNGFRGNFRYDFDKKWIVWNGIIFHPELYKYVHQLQNLYFALTGQELTLQK